MICNCVRLRARFTTPAIRLRVWALVGFDEAERFGTVHYHQAVGAA
jgi:hypothetical protein